MFRKPCFYSSIVRGKRESIEHLFRFPKEHFTSLEPKGIRLVAQDRVGVKGQQRQKVGLKGILIVDKRLKFRILKGDVVVVEI